MEGDARPMKEPITIVPRVPEMALRFDGAGLTHVGRVRTVNEDAILTDPAGIFWSIADGMGGHGHGDAAAEIVIDHLSHMPDDGAAEIEVKSLLARANRAIVEYAASVGAGVIGATVVTLKLDPTKAHVSWVGDCRAYLCRNDKIEQVTRDHTVVEDLVRDGLVKPHEAKSHDAANIVTRAVGAHGTLLVDNVKVPLTANDRMLLCSDGLNACVSDEDILLLLKKAATPLDACKYLVSCALEAGAPDNVSVIVIFAEEE